jgi:formate hydrogenlyase subunit 6/NADH:ubiquinone oxidoreductase subunit I
MNKRIKELMPKPWTFPYPDRELYTKEQFEKFAELIVRECAELCDINDKEQGDILREHFGVAE